MSRLTKRWCILAKTKEDLLKIQLILNYFNFEVEFIENLNLPVFIYKDRDSDNINYLTCYGHTKKMFFKTTKEYTIEDLLKIEV